MLQDLRECIDELLECDAFELQVHMDENGQADYYLPYMMNDALECYFILKNCKMTGDCIDGRIASGDSVSGDSSAFGNYAHPSHLEVELIVDGLTPALVIRQTNGSVATLWFRDVEKELNCYRYHEIGHFWVKGQEQWRQLVYIIGTIYDKFEYLGESICNKEELALLPLMEFAPFRYWSPIHESLDGRYPDTMDGIECFREMCEEVGDHPLLMMTERYEKMIQKTARLASGSSRISEKLAGFYTKYIWTKFVRKLSLELSKTGHEPLYELIYKKVCDASSKYPARDYGEAANTKIASERIRIAKMLVEKGFSGEYPRFTKENMSVLVTEEHPFTISMLEYDNYSFRIQLMVSEFSGESKYLNQGFFESSGNRGWIAKSVEEF